MRVWQVVGRRTAGDEPVVVGSVKAPDAGIAMMVAREAYFRHGEAVEGWIVAGDERLPIPFSFTHTTDQSYRRQDGYVGVGKRLSAAAEDLAARGLRIERSRPGART